MRRKGRLKQLSFFVTSLFLFQLILPVLSLATEHVEDEAPEVVEPSVEDSIPEEKVEETIQEEEVTPEENEVEQEQGEIEQQEDEELVEEGEAEDVEEEIISDEEETLEENEKADSTHSKNKTEPKANALENKNKERPQTDIRSNKVKKEQKKKVNPTNKHRSIPKVAPIPPSKHIPIYQGLDSTKDISDIVTEVDFEHDVISSTNRTTFLHVDLTEKVTLTGNAWDALQPHNGILQDGIMGKVLGEDFEPWDVMNYGPGEERISVTTAYCPYDEMVSVTCAWDLAEGVYSIKLSATKEDEGISGEMDVGPLFVKTTSAEIVFDEVDGPIHGNEITGTISDPFIEWAPTVRKTYDENYDVNDYLFVTYQIKDEHAGVVKEEVLEINEEGTFAIDLEGLESGHYTITVITEDAGENPTTEESISFERSHDDTGEAEENRNSEKSEDPVDQSNLVEVENLDEQEKRKDFITDSSELEGEKSVQEVQFGERLELSRDQFITIKDTSISINLPSDLPEGTDLTVMELTNEDAVGDVLDLILQLPEGVEDYESSIQLTLGVKEDFIHQDIAIFSFNENMGDWEKIGGDVDPTNQTISVPIHQPSTYGVFIDQ